MPSRAVTPTPVAVSGTGGGVGQSILKALRGSPFSAVALDSDPLGVGLYAASTSYLIPRAKSPEYVDATLAACEQTGCRLLFPGLDVELPVLSRNVDRFEAAGTTVVVSSPSVVATCDDKLATHDFLAANGLPTPRTTTTFTGGIPRELAFPFVLKKREAGARSQDVYVIRDEADLESKLMAGLELGEFVAQEHIDGDEFTCGSINLDGQCLGVIVMRRVLRNGDTYRSFAVRDERIEAHVKTVLDLLKPFGACNVQLRVRDGVPYIFEMNARCSGTTASRALCGFNEPLMVANYLVHGESPSFTIKQQTVLRYWNELVVSNDEIDQIVTSGLRIDLADTPL
jgi:carbamoyl-phosphate synthase large subunit